MFGDALKEIGDRLGVRFLLNTLVPVLLFAAALFLVYASAPGVEVTVRLWQKGNPETFPWQLGALFLALVVAAKIVEGRLLWMTRQLEGSWQWLPFGSRLRERRKRHHQRVLARLHRAGNYAAVYRGYPLPDQPEEVMPTRLGNVLKNAELYPAQRYDLDSVLLWPRFSLVLPERTVGGLSEARAALDLGVLVTFLGGGFALAATALSLALRQGWLPAVLWFAAGCAVAWLGYSAAVQGASTYGELVKSAFDLHRASLCKALGYKMPPNLEEERLFWRNLCQLLYRAGAEQEEILDFARRTEPDKDEDEKEEKKKEEKDKA